LDTGARQAPEIEIVGVAGNTKFARDIEKPARPMLYTTSLQEEIGGAAFEVRTAGSPDDVLPSIREAVEAVDPSLPIFGLLPYRVVYEVQAMGDRLVFALLTRAVGGLALLFAMLNSKERTATVKIFIPYLQREVVNSNVVDQLTSWASAATRSLRRRPHALVSALRRRGRKCPNSLLRQINRGEAFLRIQIIFSGLI